MSMIALTAANAPALSEAQTRRDGEILALTLHAALPMRREGWQTEDAKVKASVEQSLYSALASACSSSSSVQ